MTAHDRPAPLHADTLDLGGWAYQHLAPSEHETDRRLVQLVGLLVEETALALGRADDRFDAVDRMDQLVLRLRAVARLAEHVGRLDGPRFVQLTERLDAIGRQVGGWKRRLRE